MQTVASKPLMEYVDKAGETSSEGLGTEEFITE